MEKRSFKSLDVSVSVVNVVGSAIASPSVTVKGFSDSSSRPLPVIDESVGDISVSSPSEVDKSSFKAAEVSASVANAVGSAIVSPAGTVKGLSGISVRVKSGINELAGMVSEGRISKVASGSEKLPRVNGFISVSTGVVVDVAVLSSVPPKVSLIIWFTSSSALGVPDVWLGLVVPGLKMSLTVLLNPLVISPVRDSKTLVPAAARTDLSPALDSIRCLGGASNGKHWSTKTFSHWS